MLQGHHKTYAGFDPRTIKIFWEQHDQTDVELSQDVCARLAEDASYKVWELINVWTLRLPFKFRFIVI